MTHKLSHRDKLLLKQNRPKVEHVNGYLRRFRGINVKYVKQTASYSMLLHIGMVLAVAIRLSQGV